jgi:hypothetical protein
MRRNYSCRAALAAAVMSASTATIASAADPLTVFKLADEWGTINPSGARTGVNGIRFWNAEGSNNGNFASTAPFRFYTTDVKSQFDAHFGAGLWKVSTVNIVLSQSNAAFTAAGGVDLYWFADDTLQITNGESDGSPGDFTSLGASPLRYSSAANELQTARADGETNPTAIFGEFSLVDSYQFTSTGSGGDWPLDVLAPKDGDGTYNLVDPESPSIQIGSPNYGVSTPIVNPARPFRSDTLANFDAYTQRVASDLDIAAIAEDLEAGSSAISFLLVPQAATAATYKGNPFGGDFPARIYITAEEIGGSATNWNVDADGSWSTGTNWSAGNGPNGVDAVASFGGIITAARTVTVDTPQTVGAMQFDSAHGYTIAGTSAITMDVR